MNEIKVKKSVYLLFAERNNIQFHVSRLFIKSIHPLLRGRNQKAFLWINELHGIKKENDEI